MSRLLSLVGLVLLAYLLARVINNTIAGEIATLQTSSRSILIDKAKSERPNYRDWAERIASRNLFNSEPPQQECRRTFTGPRMARIIHQNGDLKIVQLRPCTLYSQFGFREGDVIKMVDGEEVTSLAQVFKIHERLKNSKKITVDIERRGHRVTLEYATRIGAD